jgi:hypothetical protein
MNYVGNKAIEEKLDRIRKRLDKKTEKGIRTMGGKWSRSKHDKQKT